MCFSYSKTSRIEHSSIRPPLGDLWAILTMNIHSFFGPGYMFHFQRCEQLCVLTFISLVTQCFWWIVISINLSRENMIDGKELGLRIVVWVNYFKFRLQWSSVSQKEIRIENEYILVCTKESLLSTKLLLDDQLICLKRAWCSQYKSLSVFISSCTTYPIDNVPFICATRL